MNVSDSELMFGVLVREGYVRTDDPAEADVLLVNTCDGPRSRRAARVGAHGELKRYKRPGDVLGVVGCMAQRLGPELLERVPQVISSSGLMATAAAARADRAGARRRAAAEVAFKGWEHYETGAPVRDNHLGIRDVQPRLRLSVHPSASFR